jgi:hypothetical protein
MLIESLSQPRSKLKSKYNLNKGRKKSNQRQRKHLLLMLILILRKLKPLKLVNEFYFNPTATLFNELNLN